MIKQQQHVTSRTGPPVCRCKYPTNLRLLARSASYESENETIYTVQAGVTPEITYIEQIGFNFSLHKAVTKYIITLVYPIYSTPAPTSASHPRQFSTANN